MKTIGCDFHPGYQQIAFLDLATGEIVESHERKEEVRTLNALHRPVEPTPLPCSSRQSR